RPYWGVDADIRALPEGGLGPRHHARVAGQSQEVRRHRDRLAPLVADRLDGFVEPLLLAGNHNHPAAIAGQVQGDGASNTVGAAGNEGDSARYAEIHCLFLIFFSLTRWGFVKVSGVADLGDR